MAELQPDVAQLTKYFDEVFKKIIEKIKKLNLSKVELAQLSSSINFLNELKALGFDKEVNKYFGSYDKIIKDIIGKATKEGVAGITGKTISDVLLVKELDTKVLLGHVSLWADTFESQLIKGVMAGLNTKSVIQSMNEIPLSTTQLHTVLNTAHSEFNRITTKKAYEAEPKQRFRYAGGLIANSSEICTALFNNQKPGGYTAEEIDAGIPAGGGIVNWSGRVPNFNCIHHWRPITKELK